MRTKIPKQQCWRCGKVFIFSSSVLGEATPQVGDVSLCIKCGAPGVFDKDMSLRKPTREEAALITEDKIITELQIFIAGIKRRT